jgi:uncharacterized membrane protein YhaH (DUF805 family)
VDNSSVDLNSAIGAMSAIFGIWMLIAVAIYVLTIWFFWRILAKAGFSGALALLNLIPLGTFVILLILAFGQWPNQRSIASAPAQPAYSPPPATS